MAKSNGPRLGLTRWSQGTDSVARTDFDGDNADLDAKVTIWSGQGTLASRPAASKAGSIYAVVGDGNAENNRKLFYDSGSQWFPIGNYGVDSLNESSVAGNTALIVRGVSGQSADILQVRDSANTNLFKVTSGGIATNQTTVGTSAGGYIGQAPAHLAAGLFNSVAVDKPVLIAQGMASQTASIFAVRNNTGSDLFSVSPNGNAVVSGNINAAGGTISGTLTVGSIANSGGTVSLRNVVATSNASSDVPLTAKGVVGQTANLINAQNSSSVTLFRVAPDGSISTSGKVKVGGGYGAESGGYGAGVPAILVNGEGLGSTTVLSVVGGSDSTNNLFDIKDSIGGTKFWVNNVGNSAQSGNSAAVSGYFGSMSGVPTQFYNSSYTPRLEVLTGTATGGFDDRVVLRHPNTSGTTDNRRVGISFNLGNESSLSSSNLSADIGVWSSEAYSANPRMSFRVAGAQSAWLYSDGSFQANKVLLQTGDGEKFRLTATEVNSIGTQPSNFYFRSYSTFSWYKGGTYDPSGPGAGGVQLMALDSSGRITADRINVNNSTGSGFDRGLRVGPLSSTHMVIGPNTIDSLLTGQTTNSILYINYFGANGEVVLGSNTTKVRLDSRTLWTGLNRVHFGNGTWNAQGGAPIANDWWFDYTNNQIKVRNDSNQWKIVADDATFG